MRQFTKVLLIDDDPVTTFFNECLIRRSGISQEVDTTTSEQEGLVWIYANCQADPGARKQKTDVLIFSDLSMIARNGFTLLNNVLELEKERVIEAPTLYFLASSEELDKRVTCAYYPVQGCLAKALTEEDINLLL
ncbi:hypothetical protein ACSX1A_10375 [Pontibacter sp. MBLB2868]|uniref:hypothetical protein n=1 Tax=Pontibacter sp. MBLB2868 TaxID=3451555 RepID=UPI003F751D2F